MACESKVFVCHVVPNLMLQIVLTDGRSVNSCVVNDLSEVEFEQTPPEEIVSCAVL